MHNCYDQMSVAGLTYFYVIYNRGLNLLVFLVLMVYLKYCCLIVSYFAMSLCKNIIFWNGCLFLWDQDIGLCSWILACSSTWIYLWLWRLDFFITHDIHTSVCTNVSKIWNKKVKSLNFFTPCIHYQAFLISFLNPYWLVMVTMIQLYLSCIQSFCDVFM